MCKACFNDKGYYKAYRERQRAKNLEAFLARNAQIAREYRAKRPELMEAYNAKRRNTLERRLLSIENYARRRTIFFDTDKKPEFLVNITTRTSSSSNLGGFRATSEIFQRRHTHTTHHPRCYRSV
ncbi:hypothetical protein HK102_011726 [Quaeritorhiza haematococci]|nr:hypothetical protein HK102_011726 [Quaeritorhiza haematococci]